MNIKSILGQLRSTSVDAQDSALHHIFKSFAPDPLPAELAEAVRNLFEKGPPWSQSLTTTICGCPTTQLRSAFRDILERGSPIERARAVTYLHLWKDESDLLASVRSTVDALSRSAHPWLAFLASMVCARVYREGESAWARAAAAIMAADQAGPMKSIRPQAEEFLQPDEIAQVNRQLVEIGASQIASATR